MTIIFLFQAKLWIGQENYFIQSCVMKGMAIMVSIASQDIKVTTMASYTSKWIKECRYLTKYHKRDPLCNKYTIADS